MGRAGTKEPLSGQRDGLCQDQSQSLGFWEGCRGKSQEPHITPERKSHPVDERATWLNEVTSDSLHVHAEGQRRGNGDEGSCASILELTVGMGQGEEGALESLREPLSLSQEAALAAVGRDLRPEDCRAPLPPTPLKPYPEFCLTQWGKLSPGLLKLKGDNF